MTEYSKYQKGIIKRFYENRDHIAVQKLGEIVSNLYVEDSAAKRKRHWNAARKHLKALGFHDHEIEATVGDEDLGRLAKLLEQVF